MAGAMMEDEAADERPLDQTADNDVPEEYAHDEDTTDPVDQDDDPWSTSASDRQPEPEPAADPAAASGAGATGKRGFLSRGKSEERIEPTFGDQELTFSRDDQGELDLENNDLFETADDDEADVDDDQQEVAEQVLIINVMARPDTVIEGSKLLPVLLKHGMRLGDMSIFHRHADVSGKGPVMFSMANMLKPGTFSMSEMETFTTKGISFFMQLPNRIGNMQCFEQMLETAEAVKTELDAQLKDENRSVFTRQTIEHCRQRIRDFELEMLARK
jgi:cell division protein ZipA